MKRNDTEINFPLYFKMLMSASADLQRVYASHLKQQSK